ncbi:MAG: type III pantothenate kinase [Clostridiales bacterium]
MFLAVDVGNTQIVLGIYQDSELLHFWRLASDVKKTEYEYLALISELLRFENLSAGDIKEMAIASVVPAITSTLQRLAKKYFYLQPLIVDSETNTGMPILLDIPDEVGADRIVNAVAAYQDHGGPLIIVDFGTATTFDCVSSAGEYLGGAIAPGIDISKEALFTKAARLSSIVLTPPHKAIGTNTADSLRSGFFWGFAGQVDGIVGEMLLELGGEAKVIATGGLAKVIADYSKTIEEVDTFLTLKGLYLIYYRNKRLEVDI